ncbi:MAG: hypothetical protein M0R51_16820 [Clostridia bacterium]|jgi:hypothetical protein|nr:hypothetical protein [Clostridia bacterium]
MVFNKVEIQGVIKHINELKTSKKGTTYLSGLIQSFNEKDGKKSFYMSIGFSAFGDKAEELGALNLQKEECVLLRGSLQENEYKGQKQLQLMVSSFVDLNRDERYAYVKQDSGEQTVYQKQEYKSPKQESANNEKYLSNPFDD